MKREMRWAEIQRCYMDIYAYRSIWKSGCGAFGSFVPHLHVRFMRGCGPPTSGVYLYIYRYVYARTNGSVWSAAISTCVLFAPHGIMQSSGGGMLSALFTLAKLCSGTRRSFWPKRILRWVGPFCHETDVVGDPPPAKCQLFAFKGKAAIELRQRIEESKLKNSISNNLA